MRILLTLLLLLFMSTPSSAREMTDMPVVKLRALDKITARAVTFEAKVGATARFGSLFMKIQACRKAPPVEQPESVAFLQVWEEVASEESGGIPESQWVFSGWMFSSSPALSYLDHPIYDVWVLDCIEEKTEELQEEQQDVLEGEGEINDSEEPVLPEADLEKELREKAAEETLSEDALP